MERTIRSPVQRQYETDAHRIGRNANGWFPIRWPPNGLRIAKHHRNKHRCVERRLQPAETVPAGLEPTTPISLRAMSTHRHLTDANGGPIGTTKGYLCAIWSRAFTLRPLNADAPRVSKCVLVQAVVDQWTRISIWLRPAHRRWVPSKFWRLGYQRSAGLLWDGQLLRGNDMKIRYDNPPSHRPARTFRPTRAAPRMDSILARRPGLLPIHHLTRDVTPS